MELRTGKSVHQTDQTERVVQGPTEDLLIQATAKESAQEFCLVFYLMDAEDSYGK